MSSLRPGQSTPTDVSEITTHNQHTPEHANSKDYDWVLPVVVVLALLILILFVLLIVLLYRRYRDSSYKRTRQCSCACGQELREIYQLRPYNGHHRRHTIETDNVDLSSNTRSGTEPSQVLFRISDTDPEVTAVRSATGTSSTAFREDMSDANTDISNGDETSLFPERVHMPSQAVSGSMLPLVGTELMNARDTERNIGAHDTNKNSQYSQSHTEASSESKQRSWSRNISQSLTLAPCMRNASTQSHLSGNVVFYLGDGSRSGIENEAFSDSDLDCGISRNKESASYAAARGQGNRRLEKSVTVTGLGNTSDRDGELGYLDRQISNQSVPAYSQDVSFSTELGQPFIGKFETVYDLASSKNYEDERVTSGDLRESFAADVGSRKNEAIVSPEVEPSKTATSRDVDAVAQMSRDRRDSMLSSNLTHQIPTIILPKGGYIDYDSDKDKMSFYNSSSLESDMSSPTHRRARPNNPFCIEADRPPYAGDIVRPSSAPTIRRQSLEGRNSLLGEMTRSSSGYYFSPPGGSSDGGWFPDLRRDCSRSWSEDFYDAVYEPGVTDADRQLRMKEMIDAKYSSIFDKRYPELNSLYPLLHHREKIIKDRRLTPKKKKLKSKKRRKVPSANDSSGSDQFDRLKPPEIASHSERRPVRFVREGPYGEDCQPEPDKKQQLPYPKSRISHGLSLSSLSDKTPTLYGNSRDSSFLPLEDSEPSLHYTESNSPNADPLYESIPSPQSSFYHSSPNSSMDMGRQGADKIIYDRIGDSPKDDTEKGDHPKNELDNVTSTQAPLPPSTSPPPNPKLIRQINYVSNPHNVCSESSMIPPEINSYSVSIDDTLEDDIPDLKSSDKHATHTKEIIIGIRAEEASTVAVLPNTTEEEIRTTNPHVKQQRSQSVHFVVSSGDTPLEHPPSSEYNYDHDSSNAWLDVGDSLGSTPNGSVRFDGNKTPSQHAEGIFTAVPYRRQTWDGSVSCGKEGSLTEQNKTVFPAAPYYRTTSDGSVCSQGSDALTEDEECVLPYQRRTMSTNYDDSIQISRV